MKFVVWPSEIDSRLPRKYGRLVKKEVALEAPPPPQRKYAMPLKFSV